MRRTPEPELMDDEAQVRAYADADFQAPHDRFVELFGQYFPEDLVAGGEVLDLGCGPADVTLRFARAFPRCHLLGVDAGDNMLKYAQRSVAAAGMAQRVTLLKGHVPDETLPKRQYDGVISNSLLHHMAEPLDLWRAVKAYAAPNAPVFVMDLMRPPSLADAEGLVAEYAEGAPPVLRRDFYHSLLAAYRPDEVADQLRAAGLGDFRVASVSDRHLLVFGRGPG